MQAIILVIHLVLAIALVAVILMQRSEGGALGGLGGGGGGGGGGLGDFMSARGATNFLTRMTAILATAFMVTSLLLTILAAGGRSDEAPMIQDNRIVPQEAPADTQPAEPSVPFSE
ncbi:MAG: preprotein translocase subunit SecG [Alphaproteobacteria bacterium]|nr:preprotein translocase subunit SecG [Alphaproteobacteria bacterium]